MEMFDVHRRDILSFDNYMDLKKPGFGGPASAQALRDQKGNKINKEPKLADYQRTVERDPAFSNPVWNPTYKAMTHDLVYKQEKKKPFTYPDPYLTGVPVVELDDAIEEGKTFTNFSRFINEAMEAPLEEIEARFLEIEEEGGEEDFGANPMGMESPTGEPMPDEIQKWIASLQQEREIESGLNPFRRLFGGSKEEYFEECPECGGEGGDHCSTCGGEGTIPLQDDPHSHRSEEEDFRFESDPTDEPESHREWPDFYLESEDED